MPNNNEIARFNIFVMEVLMIWIFQTLNLSFSACAVDAVGLLGLLLSQLWHQLNPKKESKLLSSEEFA